MKHKTISLADQVFERLENDIISGKYQRGQILTELGLTEDLQVSRTPIREALPAATITAPQYFTGSTVRRTAVTFFIPIVTAPLQFS